MTGLTYKDKTQAYRRISYGSRTVEPILGHIMQHLSHTISQMEEYPECEDVARKYRLIHRLVSRGLISSHTQFDRITKHLLNQKETTCQTK